MEEIVKALLEQNAKLTEHIVELSKELARVSEQPVYVQPEPMFRQFPLHVPESEEDARAAFEAGDITRDELQEVLKEVEFYNHEITVPTPGV